MSISLWIFSVLKIEREGAWMVAWLCRLSSHCLNCMSLMASHTPCWHSTIQLTGSQVPPGGLGLCESRRGDLVVSTKIFLHFVDFFLKKKKKKKKMVGVQGLIFVNCDAFYRWKEGHMAAADRGQQMRQRAEHQTSSNAPWLNDTLEDTQFLFSSP